jgi:tight adherence protein C
MIVLSLIALALLAVSAVLVMRALALPRMKSAERVRSIEYYGFDAAKPLYAPEKTDGPAFAGLAISIGTALARRIGVGSDELRRDLVTAGFYKLSPTALLGYRVLSGVAIGILGLVATQGSGAAVTIIAGGFGALFGWFLPVGYVQRSGRYRLAEIDRELPDLIDLMVVTIEAGLTLSASMQLASTKFTGPLGEELRITLQEQRMGRSLHDALLGLLGRCDTPNVRSFVRSVTQGENLGVSIGSIMRNLAEEMRKRRRAAAEKMAQKAPVKILFPLVFLILPAFVIIILAPPVITVLDSFGN